MDVIRAHLAHIQGKEVQCTAAPTFSLSSQTHAWACAGQSRSHLLSFLPLPVHSCRGARMGLCVFLHLPWAAPDPCGRVGGLPSTLPGFASPEGPWGALLGSLSHRKGQALAQGHV